MATLSRDPRTTRIEVATASAGPFSLGLRIFSTDLVVYVGTSLRTDWTLTGSFAKGYSDDAAITFDAALASGSVITIDPLIEPGRDLDYAPTDRALTDKINLENGQLWAAVAELRRDVDRSFRTYGDMEPARFPAPGTDGPVGWSGDALISYDLFQGDFPGLRTFGSRGAVLAFAAQNPSLGTLASQPGAVYRYDGASSGIADLPGWVPEGYVTPWHFGGDPTGGTASQAALLAADAWCVANEGTRLLIDRVCAISAPVSLRSRVILCPGRIKLLSTFAPGAGVAAIRLGDDTQDIGGRAAIDLFVDGTDYCGTPRTTWSPLSGAFPSGSAAGDSYKVREAGSFGGQTFVAGDCLIARVDAASTTTFAANWFKRARLSAVLADGLAFAFTRVFVEGQNCDTLLHVRGNSERGRYQVGGRDCHELVREEGVEGGGSPDNNQYRIVGGSFGRAYNAILNPLSDVHFEVQAQLAGYRLPVVSIGTSRKVILRGEIRVPTYRVIEIDQDASGRGAGLILAHLQITAPDVTTPNDWLVQNDGGAITGEVTIDAPTGGAIIKAGSGHNLVINVEGQKAGAVLTIGSGASTVKESRFVVKHSRPDGADTMLQLNSWKDSVVQVLGTPLPVRASESATSNHLILPAAYIITDTLVNAGDATVEFVGKVGRSYLLAFGSPDLGMRATTESGLTAIYTGGGDGWQTPTLEDLP